MFTIDPYTGALSISQGAVPQKNQYEITVKAANQLNSNSINQHGSTAVVNVNFPEFQSQVESHHHIEKRVKIRNKAFNEFFHQISSRQLNVPPAISPYRCCHYLLNFCLGYLLGYLGVIRMKKRIAFVLRLPIVDICI
jgi:hypothetical protein